MYQEVWETLSLQEWQKLSQPLEEGVAAAYPEPPVAPYIPRFALGEEAAGPVAGGRALHKFMEYFDFCQFYATMGLETSVAEDAEAFASSMAAGLESGQVGGISAARAALEAQVRSALDSGRLLREEMASLPLDKVACFLAQDLARRIWRAELAGVLRRERSFVYGVPAARVYGVEEMSEAWEDRVLIQGRVDLFFSEGDALVLVDYKSDRGLQPQGFWQRYGFQLDFYREALEAIWNKPVTEVWIYAFALDRALQKPAGAE